MKSLLGMQVAVILGLIVRLRIARSEETVEVGDSSTVANVTGTHGGPVEEAIINTVIREICNTSNTFEYCSCREDVVNCDLTNFPGSLKNRSIVHLHGQSISQTVKRLCVCNSPVHVQVQLDENLLPYGNFIHRVDIFNLSGPLLVKAAFRNGFSGDFYMSHVNYWWNLHSHEFGRGNDSLKIEDVEHIECCSKIKSSPVFRKPTLYMDHVRIGTIHAGGLNGFHLWKSLILNSVNVANVMPLGINIGDVPDISITRSVFQNVNNTGIKLTKFENLLFAQNYIGFNHHKLFTAKSSRSNSTILNLENHFDFPYFWSLDAKHVVSWLNQYFEWDRFSFLLFNDTKFSDRKVSVEYNTVQLYSSFALPTGNIEDPVFYENILGICNCSLVLDPEVTLPAILESSRCSIRLESKNNRSCWINYKRVVDECKKGHVDDDAYFKLCEDSSVAIPHDTHDPADVKPMVSTKEIKNRFFEEMLKNVHFRVEMNKILFAEGSKRPSTSHQVVSGHHVPSSVATWITVSGAVFGATLGIVGVLWIRKRRRSGMYREPAGSSFDLLTSDA